ncbi:MAG: PAS domain-containing protein [Rhodospirillaceae bacterium]|nr:PAS domain-containing protein [Rhodospirillaceae bacterium]
MLDDLWQMLLGVQYMHSNSREGQTPFFPNRSDDVAKEVCVPYARITTTAFLDECSDTVAAFYAYWDSKRNGRLMPSRVDIDPVEMKRWLPSVTIVDVQRHPQRLVYRLVGTRSVELRGRDVTGLTVEQGYHGTTLEDVLENYRLIIDEKKVVYDLESSMSSTELCEDGETLMLPLSSDGEVVDKVLIYVEVTYLKRSGVHRSTANGLKEF